MKSRHFSRSIGSRETRHTDYAAVTATLERTILNGKYPSASYQCVQTHISLCLTCEKQCKGGFTGKEMEPDLDTRSRSPSMSSSTRVGSPMSSRKPVKPSALRNALSDLNLKSQLDDFEPDDDAPIAGPSGTQTLDSEPVTPRKLKHNPSFLSVGRMDSPATDATSDPGSPSEGQPPKRERYQRKAARNAQHFSFLKRPKKVIEVMPELDQSVMDEEDEDCVRCATCARALHERIWYNNRYFDHCAR
jgi:ferredoxin